MFKAILGSLAFSTFLSSAVLASELVVLKAQGIESIKPGDILDGKSSVNLAPGAVLVLISSQGKKIMAEGPFDGPLEADNTASTTASETKDGPGIGLNLDVVKPLARLFKARMVDTGSLGAFRSIGGAPALSDPWMIDITKEGNHCFDPSQGVKLWRADKKQDEIISIDSGQGNVMVTWAAGTDALDWPVELGLNDGANYHLSRVDGSKQTEIQLHKVPQDLPTRVHISAWMAEQKCDEQAMLLVLGSDIDKMLDSLAKQGKF